MLSIHFEFDFDLERDAMKQWWWGTQISPNHFLLCVYNINNSPYQYHKAVDGVGDHWCICISHHF